MTTGFLSYHIYNIIRYIYFNSNKRYDIINQNLPRKELFIKKWNEEMIYRKDSLYFLKLDKLFNKEQLIRLFSYYYIEYKDFYINDIFDNDMKLFRINESNLLLLKDVIETDIISILYLAKKNKRSFRDMLFQKNGIPIIFQLYDRKKISIYTIISFHLAFQIIDKINNKSLNIIDVEKHIKYKKIIDKFLPIVYKYYDFNVKEYIINCLGRII